MTERRPLRGRREHDATVAETLLDELGPRLAALRRKHGVSLAELAEETGVSRSTRRPEGHSGFAGPGGAGLRDDAKRAPRLPGYSQFRMPSQSGFHTSDMITWPLTRSAVSPVPFKTVYSATASTSPARLPRHDGWTWIYMIAGRLRVIVEDENLVLEPGRTAEIDTRRAHWIGSTGEGPVEVLTLFGSRGEMPLARILPAGRPSDTDTAHDPSESLPPR